MRYLGLDLGSKTLGLSISDRTNTIASVYTTLRFENEDYDSLIIPLKKIIEENNITNIILGLPINMNGSYGNRANISVEFKEKLEKNLNISVELMDERLTSVISNDVLIKADVSRKKRKNKVDGMAAVVILQNYLDKKGNGYE